MISPLVFDVIFITLLFLGIFLCMIPTLPGMAYMFLVVLIFGFLDRFERLEPEHLIIFGAFVLISIFLDYASGLIGAKFGGANTKSLLAGIFGLFVGLILFPPFGLFLGLFAGVLIGEIVQGNHKKALKAASYAFLGSVTGMILGTCLAILFFVTFLLIIY